MKKPSSTPTLDSDRTVVMQDAFARLDTSEIDVLSKIYKSLSSKEAPFIFVDKVTFLQFFTLPGLWGERLFDYFSFKQSVHNNRPVIDYSEFIFGITQCCRSSPSEQIQIIFQLFDLDNDGFLSSSELISLFYNIPNVNRYLLSWEDIVVDAPILSSVELCDSEIKRSSSITPRTPRTLLTITSSQKNAGMYSDPLYPTNYLSLVMDSDDDQDYVNVDEVVTDMLPTVSCPLDLDMTVSQMSVPADLGMGFLDQDKDMTVVDIVNHVFQKIGGSSSCQGIDYIQFKSWVQNDALGLISLFTNCLHEEFWSLQGRFRGEEKGIKKRGHRKFRRSRPDVSTCGSSPRWNPLRHLKSMPESAVFQCRNVLSYIRLQNEFSLSVENLGASLSSFNTDLLGCPSCSRVFAACPLCAYNRLSLRVCDSNKFLVLFCAMCRNREGLAFDGCWFCHWKFSNASLVRDRVILGDTQVLTSKGHKEGYMKKYGRRSQLWKRRYYVQLGSMLYYYKKRNDPHPCGVIFLGDCYVMKLTTSASTNDAKLLKKKFQTTHAVSLPRSSMSHDNVDPLGVRPAKRRAQRTDNHWGLSLVQKSGNHNYVREFYLSSKVECDAWMRQLCYGTGQRKVDQVYRFEKSIGSGKFSVVHRAVNVVSGQEVAIKVIKHNETTATDREMLKTEVRVVSILSHPSIVKIHDTFLDDLTVCIVMDLAEGGQLGDLLARRLVASKGEGMSEVEAQHIMKELFVAVAYLQQCGIAHRDLKPDNILISYENEEYAFGCAIPNSSSAYSGYHIKLTDFGLSSICGHRRVMTHPCGTLPYVAPEVWGNTAYGLECDVWACGVIMYLLLRGRLPFNPTSGNNDINSYQINLEDPSWSHRSAGAKDLIARLLTVDVDDRITPNEALQHFWIKNPSAAISAPKASQPPTHLALVPDVVGEDDM
eukprot:GHVH01004793.1.p1 GENE.GHVH01004793.1~~GHVH01004793.1.p1  ORF type:complete len:931 (-),score=92.09 GHVH01004793.1:1003-3795(-)